MTKEWMPIETLPPPGDRPGQVWVLVEGWQHHSGNTWRRRHAGLARTHNEGFEDDDIRLIEKRDHMEPMSGSVTHWLPIDLPNYPQEVGGAAMADAVKFAEELIRLWWDGDCMDIDGAEFQELAVKHGLISYRKPTAEELADPDWFGHEYVMGPDDEGVGEFTPEFSRQLVG